MTTRDELFVALARAERNAENPIAKDQIRQARHLVADLPLRRLDECSVCGVLGLPEHIADHDCRAYACERIGVE